MHRIDPSIHSMFAHFAHMMRKDIHEQTSNAKTRNSEHTKREKERERKQIEIRNVHIALAAHSVESLSERERVSQKVR